MIVRMACMDLSPWNYSKARRDRGLVQGVMVAASLPDLLRHPELVWRVSPLDIYAPIVLRRGMKNPIRPADFRLFSAVIPLARLVPSEVISNSESYQKMVRAVPDWFFWVSLGFVAAAWLLDPWQEQSRLRDWWHKAVDRFQVEHLYINEPLSADGNVLTAEMRIRFRRATRGHLWLRVFSCTGLTQAPGEDVTDLGMLDMPKGGQKVIELARLTLPYGSSPQNAGLAGMIQSPAANTLIGRSQNIIQLELTGVWPKQIYRCMVARSDYSGGQTRPGLFVVGENEDIFDGRRNVV